MSFDLLLMKTQSLNSEKCLKSDNQYLLLLSHICIVNDAFWVKFICMQNWHLRAIKSNSEWRQNHSTGKISTRNTFFRVTQFSSLMSSKGEGDVVMGFWV